MAEDIFLSGGNVAGQVIRRGDTILKPPTPFDDATTALLTQFAAAGVEGVPQPRGVTPEGQRILTWVPGDTVFPARMWDELVTLETAAKRLRVLHDASVPLVGPERAWAYSDPDPARHEVICHNDYAPYNMTFAPDGAVAGVFDFDLAGPGPRLRDLAYLAWWLVPLGRSDRDMAQAAERDMAAGSSRLLHLCDSYGVQPAADLLDMVADVLVHMQSPQAAESMIGPAATERLRDGGHFAHWGRAAADFAGLRPGLAANLGLPERG